ncbi:MAG: iron(III) transport system substrate-binding protein [Solirubrobacteraceae bacterium]|nr:iron(III) transport system substrate-binding protein [Solirubrobacteraceae bacterium]
MVAVAVSLSACGGGSSSADLTVYSGQHLQTMTKLVADFKKRTGKDVQLRPGSESSLANQLLREGSASPADVFVTENPPAMTAVERKGLLAPLAPAALAKTPSRFHPPQGDWVPVSARAAVLVYNPSKVKPADLPQHLRELAGPKWRGKVAIAPGESDFHPLITALGKLEGQDAVKAWLKGLKSNGKVYDDSEAVVVAVNRGDVPVGLIDHYYWYRGREEIGASKMHSALHYFAPKDAGALVDVAGAGVLKAAKHAKLAQQFVDYLVSKPAQEIIAAGSSYEYPLGSGVTTKRDLKPFDQLRPPDVSVEDLGDGRDALRALQDAGLL